MYIPKHYREDDWEQAEYLIKTYPLGTLITTDSTGGIIANHIPFYLTKTAEGNHKLIAHVAKSNHQIPSLTANSNVLIVFQSVNSYITPDYYPGKQETHKYVPTWNFASVHLHGSSKIVDDVDFVRNQLDHLTEQEESVQKKDGRKQWKVSDAPENYVKILQKAITGLEISIDSFECKYKFDQAMRKADVDGTIEGLAQDGKVEISQLAKETNARADAKKAEKKAQEAS
ncbi:uncharacterized protein LODBEIA_P57990 [Lodderomyces beijingensis]|uniref:Transcriptional regulator n=1 Tax=Lodderomyces beijingensis TaxID=1775926 RepID=A0ABP0ZTW5_9ASCO